MRFILITAAAVLLMIIDGTMRAQAQDSYPPSANTMTCADFTAAYDIVYDSEKTDSDPATVEGWTSAVTYFGFLSYANGYWQNYLDTTHTQYQNENQLAQMNASVMSRCRAQPDVRYVEILRSLRNDFATLTSE